MSARDVEIRTGVWIGPQRRLDEARHVRVRASKLVLEYPNDTTAEDLPAILEEVSNLRRAFNPQEKEDSENA